MEYVRTKQAGRAAAHYVINRWPTMFPHVGTIKVRETREISLDMIFVSLVMHLWGFVSPVSQDLEFKGRGASKPKERLQCMLKFIVCVGKAVVASTIITI